MVTLPNLPGLVGSLFAIIPTMLVLYFMLRRYDRFFEERRLLFALLFGLLVGAVLTMVETLFIAFHEPAYLRPAPLFLSLLVLALTYPFIETLGKLVVVNWHTYRGRRDTPYYAVGIGLGFAAVNVFIIAARGMRDLAQVWEDFNHLQVTLHVTLLLLLYMTGIMAHGISTTAMGQAIADRDLLRCFFYGAILLAPYYIAYWGYYVLTRETIIGYLFPLAGVAYGILGIRYVIRNILEPVVPAKERRRLLREMEKADAAKREEPRDE